MRMPHANASGATLWVEVYHTSKSYFRSWGKRQRIKGHLCTTEVLVSQGTSSACISDSASVRNSTTRAKKPTNCNLHFMRNIQFGDSLRASTQTQNEILIEMMMMMMLLPLVLLLMLPPSLLLLLKAASCFARAVPATLLTWERHTG